MNSLGFLSEMSALPIHGGGVTLQRVLGNQLAGFDWFAKTLHFPAEQYPSYEESRSYCFDWWPIEKLLRPVIGCSRAYRIASKAFLKRQFSRRVVARLLREEKELMNSRMLVCPQGYMSLLVLNELQKRGRLEYVTWVMDDHLLQWQDGEWRYPSGMKSLMEEHLIGAEEVFVISPALQKYYRQEFGVESTVLCGPAEVNEADCFRRGYARCL